MFVEFHLGIRGGPKCIYACILYPYCFLSRVSGMFYTARKRYFNLSPNNYIYIQRAAALVHTLPRLICPPCIFTCQRNLNETKGFERKIINAFYVSFAHATFLTLKSKYCTIVCIFSKYMQPHIIVKQFPILCSSSWDNHVLRGKTFHYVTFLWRFCDVFMTFRNVFVTCTSFCDFPKCVHIAVCTK